MGRVRQQPFARCYLDELAGIHDANSVGDLGQQGKVVGDVKHGHTNANSQILQELDDLPLRGDVQARRRFVKDKQIRIA